MKHFVSNAYNEMVLSQNNAICHIQVDSDKKVECHIGIIQWWYESMRMRSVSDEV